MTTSEPLGNIKIDTKFNTECKLSDHDLLSYLKRTTKFELCVLGYISKNRCREVHDSILFLTKLIN